MLLVILFLTYEGNHSIPTQRYVFYEEAYNALAVKHDAAKALSRPFVTNLSSWDFKRYFGEFYMLTYYDEKYSFSYEEIIGYFQRVIRLTLYFGDPSLMDAGSHTWT